MKREIDEKRLKELERIEKKMRYLEQGGVDNWEWYDESLTEYYKEEEQEEKIDEVMVELEVAFLNGAYEPSEKGAGYASSDDGRKEAEEILRRFIKEITTTN